MLVPELRDLFEQVANGHDGAIGSRFSYESVLINYPFFKILCNRAFHLLVKLTLLPNVRDVSNNLKLYRSEILKTLDIEEPHFAANMETGLKPLLAGYDIREVPVSWINRTTAMGASSFRIVRVAPGYFRALMRTIGRGLARPTQLQHVGHRHQSCRSGPGLQSPTLPTEPANACAHPERHAGLRPCAVQPSLDCSRPHRGQSRGGRHSSIRCGFGRIFVAGLVLRRTEAALERRTLFGPCRHPADHAGRVGRTQRGRRTDATAVLRDHTCVVLVVRCKRLIDRLPEMLAFWMTSACLYVVVASGDIVHFGARRRHVAAGNHGLPVFV